MRNWCLNGDKGSEFTKALAPLLTECVASAKKRYGFRKDPEHKESRHVGRR